VQRDLLKGVRLPQLEYDPSVYSDRRVNEQADVGPSDRRRLFSCFTAVYATTYGDIGPPEISRDVSGELISGFGPEGLGDDLGQRSLVSLYYLTSGL
jgi:hypothetical protein